MRKIIALLLGAVAGLVWTVAPATAHQDQIGKPYKDVVITGMADGSQTLKVDGVEIGNSRVKAKAQASALTADYVHTPWTGVRFDSQYACVQNNIGSLWNIDYARTQFESGVRSMVLTYLRPSWGDEPCSTYFVDKQIIMVGTYQGAYNECYHVSGSYSDPGGRWRSKVTVALNASASSNSLCRSSQQLLNNNVSQGLGTALGLDDFNRSDIWTASIMNNHFAYNWPGWEDRTSLCYLLGICPD